MSLLAELETILDAERLCLCAGRIGDLGSIVGRKEAAISALVGRPEGPRGRLVAVLAQAKANQTLLEAARKGVQAAELRLRAIRDVGRGLTAYTADGRSICHATGPSSVERRA